MLKNPFFKNAWPHVVAIGVLVILAAIYFSPLLQGYDLNQSDIVNWRGMSQESANYRALNNEEALWSDAMFGGMPTYQTSLTHSANVLRPILLTLRLGLPGAIGTLFLCFLGYYILGLSLRLGPWYSLIGAVAFGFATINILYLGAGHTGKVTSIAFLAPALGGFIMAYRGKLIRGAAVFMLFLGLNIAANHLQMTYYLAILLAAVAVGEFIRLVVSKEIKKAIIASSVLVVAAGISVLPNASNLMTTLEYSKYTTRGSSDLTIKPASGSNMEKEGLSENYILDYNFASGEQWSILIPNVKGGAAGAIGRDHKDAIVKAAAGNKNVNKFKDDLKGQNAYWGDQHFSGGAFYFGAIAVFLFVLSFVGVKDSLKWPFLIISFLALALCLKEYAGFNKLFIEDVPMYNKFRDSKMILVLIQLIAAAWGMVFLKQLVEEGFTWSKRKKSIVLGAVGVSVLTLVLILVSPGMTGDFQSAEEEKQFAELRKNAGDEQQDMIDNYESALVSVRQEILIDDAKRSLMLVFLVGGVVIALMYVQNKGVRQAAIPVFGLLILFDGMSVSKRYLNLEKEKGQYKSFLALAEKELPIRATRADASILDREKIDVEDFEGKSAALKQANAASGDYTHVKASDLDTLAMFGALQLNSDFRVVRLGNPFNDASTSFYHKSIGGYHGAKLKAYQEVIDFYLAEQTDSLLSYLRAGTYDSLGNSLGIVNMLNTKYIIGNPNAPAMRNPFANGPAWFVSQVRAVENSDAEMTELGKINTRNEAVVQNKFANDFHSASTSVDSTATVNLKNYATNSVSYTVNNTSSESQPVVFSEIYYPKGWVCKIDGAEVNYAKVNYILRGIMVPAGSHEVVWSFEPAVWKTGNSVSYAGSVVLLLLLLGAGFYEFKNRKN